jgi:hypothetical protein
VLKKDLTEPTLLEMSGCVGEAEVDLKLRADSHGAGIREDHALGLAVIERRVAVETGLRRRVPARTFSWQSKGPAALEQ